MVSCHCHHNHSVSGVLRQVVENAVFPSNPASPLWRHITVTVIIVFLVGAVSMSTDCLGIVLTFNVSTTCSLTRPSALHAHCDAHTYPPMHAHMLWAYVGCKHLTNTLLHYIPLHTHTDTHLCMHTHTRTHTHIFFESPTHQAQTISATTYCGSHTCNTPGTSGPLWNHQNYSRLGMPMVVNITIKHQDQDSSVLFQSAFLFDTVPRVF